MTEFKTDASKDRYELIFTTDNEEYYHRMQDEARRCIDDSQKKDLVFECYDCGHLLFVQTENKTAIDIGKTLEKTSCPNCGISTNGTNWFFTRLGNYEKEYEEKKDD